MNKVYVSTDNWGFCKGCGNYEDLREGYCYECCIRAEYKAGLITEEEFKKELARIEALQKQAS